jgi:uncharacterized protein (TIGR02145 family)
MSSGKPVYFLIGGAMKLQNCKMYYGLMVCFLFLCLLVPSAAVAEKDVTNLVELRTTRMYYLISAQTCSVGIKNTSDKALTAPIKVIIDDISPEGVKVLNPDGIMDGKPYLEYTTRNGELLPGQYTYMKKIYFSNPVNTNIRIPEYHWLYSFLSRFQMVNFSFPLRFQRVNISYSLSVFSADDPPQDTCGAYVAEGVWKEFDCYNLAAIGKVTGADPFTPSWELNGGYWQWGRKGPDPDVIDWYNTNTSNFAHGPTGPELSDANDGTISDWVQSEAPDGAWSDATKTENDPCPVGFRVPTISQWQGVLDTNNNTQSTEGTWNSSPTNYSSALFFGNDLMLPAAGYRQFSSGALLNRGNSVKYWSSSEFGSYFAWNLYFDSEDAISDSNFRWFGYSVRCVKQDGSGGGGTGSF